MSSSSPEQHLDAQVQVTQRLSWPIILSLIGLSGAGISAYADLISRDREQSVRIEQLRADVTRIQGEQRDLRVDIRADLVELKAEVRQLRADMAERRATR